MMLPKITVITPALNTGASIETALKSVATQTYQNIEHIIVDGASKDKTLPTIRKYQKMYKHIRLLTEKDSGVYQAMNKGMDLSTGDWMYFMGADDAFYNENTLTDLYEQGLFQEEQIVYGNVSVLGDTSWAKNGSIYDGPFELKKLLKKNICHQAIFYPSSVIKQIGYFTEKYSTSSDWDYNLRCFIKYKFTYADKIIAFFKTGGISMGGDDSLSKDFVNNIKQHFQLDPYSVSVYDEDSPFYYLMSRYREMELHNRIIALGEEAERLRQHIAGQQTGHLESVTNMGKQHEKVISDMRLEFDETLSNLRTENTNFLFTLRTEHDQVIAALKEENASHLTNLKTEYDQKINDLREEQAALLTSLKTEYSQVIATLKEEHASLLSNLKTEHDNNISNLKVEHGHFVTNLRTEYNQEISNLKIEYDHLLSNQRTEHNQETTNLKIEHSHFVSDLRIEHNQAIGHQKSEQDLLVKALKSSHIEAMNAQKEDYEEIVRSLQAEKSSFLKLFQQKEAEFTQVMEAGNQHVEQLTSALASNKLHFAETIERHKDDITNLQAAILAKQKEIDTIFNSYTWKVGKVLLSPPVFIAKKLKHEKN